MPVTQSFRVSKEQRERNATKRAEIEPALQAKYGVTFSAKDVSDSEVEVTVEAPSQEVLDQLAVEFKGWGTQ